MSAAPRTLVRRPMFPHLCPLSLSVAIYVMVLIASTADS